MTGSAHIIPNSGLFTIYRWKRLIALDAAGNKLILAGMNERILKQLQDTELMALLGEEDIFAAEEEYFGPLKEALVAANNWFEAKKDSGKE